MSRGGGRWRREAALAYCFGLQNIRSSKYSAAMLWQRTVAAPNSLWLAPGAKGCRLAAPLGVGQNTKSF